MNNNIFYAIDVVSAVSLLVLTFLSLIQGGYKNVINRLFATFSIVTTIWILSSDISSDVAIPHQIALIADYISDSTGMLSLLLILCIVLFIIGAKKIQHLKFIRRSVVVLSIACILSATPLIVSDIEVSGDLYVDQYGPLVWLNIIATIYIVGLLAYEIIYGIRHTTKLKKSQLTATGIGLLLSLPLLLSFSLFMPLLGETSSILRFSATPIIILVFFLYYSVIRYHLFDIRLAAVRTLAYASSLIIFVYFYLGLVTVASIVFLNSKNAINQSPVSVMVVLLLLVIYPPIKRFFDHWTNRIFYRDYYNTDELYLRLNRIFSSTTNLSEMLVSAANEISTTIKSEQAFFYVYTKGDDYIVAGTQGHTPIPKSENITKSEFTEMLNKYGNKNNITVTSVLARNNPLRKVLAKHKVELLLSLIQDNTIGYLCLGEHKISHYTNRDIKVLSTIADGLVVAIQNALSIQKVKEISESSVHQRIKAATSELRKSNSLLRSIDDEKNEFISIASHELRTPMTVIRGFLNLLEREQLGKINSQQKEVLSKMSLNAKNLIDLVNNMLDLSKLESGKLEIKLADASVRQLVNKSVDEIELLYSSKGIKLSTKSIDDKIIILTDSEKFIRIMLNLLSNAYKFTSKGGEVTVTVDANPDTKLATICVADTGLGIPADSIDDLFKKFSQVDNYLQRQSGGTGLGLSICKQLVEKMGGTIWVESKLNVGSKFYFTMPLGSNKTN